MESAPNYGPFATEKKALRFILDRLAKALNPFRIYLFGSRAEGRATSDSDFDLVVVFDDQAPNADADYDEVYAPLLGLGIDCDVIPCRRSEFQAVLDDPFNPWRPVWETAKRVYERSASAYQSVPSAS